MMAHLRSPSIWFTLLFVVSLAVYFGWLAVAGAGKLAAAGLPEGPGRHHVEIVLSVEPEQFHMTRLQAQGRFIRFEDNSAFIMDLPQPALEALSRNYWVEGIRPWAGL